MTLSERGVPVHENLKWRFICHRESTFQKFPVEVFVHRKKKRFGIPDHPVCHSSSGDLYAILFPVLFLTVVWKTITKLLVHYPGNCSGRSHSIKHMGSAIFSFFNDRNILKFALRTLIVLTIVFIYFQFCRYKNQLPADKLFPDFFQWSTTGRAEFLFLRKFRYFFSTGTPLNRSASVALAFRFFAVFSGRMLQDPLLLQLLDSVPVPLH